MGLGVCNLNVVFINIKFIDDFMLDGSIDIIELVVIVIIGVVIIVVIFVIGEILVLIIVDMLEYIVMIVWSENLVIFEVNKVYIVIIIIKFKVGYIVIGILKDYFKVDGVIVINDVDLGVVIVVFLEIN